MEEAFVYVLVGAVVVGVVISVVSLAMSGGMYDSIGKGALSLDQPDRPSGPPPETDAARAEAQAEIRQLVEAKSARREARGETPLDVEAEIAALTRPPAAARDDALRQEVRQLVVASNERRMRRGEEPLDVEQEVERQLRDLGG